MGISDKLNDLTQKAKDVAGEHHDQILDVVQRAETAADKQTGGRYRDQITRTGGKARSYVGRLKPEATDANTPATPPASAA